MARKRRGIPQDTANLYDPQAVQRDAARKADTATRQAGRVRWGGARSQRLVRLTLETYGLNCHLCGRGPSTGHPAATSADHVLPRIAGGTNALANLRPAHKACNTQRGDLALDEYWRRLEAGKLRRLPLRADGSAARQRSQYEQYLDRHPDHAPGGHPTLVEVPRQAAPSRDWFGTGNR